MKLNLAKKMAGALLLAGLCVYTAQAQTPTAKVFADFNANESTFNLHPTYSGSTAGLLTTSTADLATSPPPIAEGTGFERLVLFTNGVSTVPRVRFLSGGGAASGNSPFPTSSGVDGWIGFYARTTNTGWNAQLWIENAGVNGGVPKEIPSDGEWHLLEWDLDDTTGGTNGWGNIAGIVDGSATVADGDHTIDSIMLRCTNAVTGTHVIDLDFVARNPNGSVADLIVQPCRDTPALTMDSGPVSANSTQVLAKAVSETASEVKVYQNTGSGWTQVGSRTTGIVAGNNWVPVSGLIAGAQLGAVQVVNGVEGCAPDSVVVVGGGANPPVRIALSVSEIPEGTTPTTPGQAVGAVANISFLGATASSARDAQIFYPSNDWQTVTFERVFEGVDDVTGVQRDILPPTGGNNYTENTTVTARVYAFRTVNGVRAFSTNFEEVSATSNGVYVVNWSWNVVPEAEGYRIVREYAPWGSGFLHFVDVSGANSFLDENSLWDFVVPEELDVKGFQTTPSWTWNVATGTAVTNNLPNTWYGLDAIAFNGVGDSGPYDIYIDNLMNGPTTINDFEGSPAGLGDYGFQPPNYSGTTAGNLLLGSSGAVSNLAADNSTKAYRAQWQWKSLNPLGWLRFTPYAAIQPLGNGTTRPAVRLDQPITFRMLMLPKGATPPAAPPAPLLSVQRVGNDVVLDWDGAHRLQAATNVAGPFTAVPQTVLPPNTNTFLGPWTNSTTDSARFFRLVD